MYKFLIVSLLTFMTTSSFAVGSQGGGFGKGLLLQASFNNESDLISDLSTTDLIEASISLSNGDVLLAEEILKSYNHDVALDIVYKNPLLSMYEPSHRVEAVAKFSVGISYLDQIEAVDRSEAVNSLSRQLGVFNRAESMNLNGVFEATQEGVIKW